MMLDSVAWLRDKSDRRVLAALERKCPAATCLVPPGEWCRGTVFPIHQIRIPEKVLLQEVSS